MYLKRGFLYLNIRRIVFFSSTLQLYLKSHFNLPHESYTRRMVYKGFAEKCSVLKTLKFSIFSVLTTLTATLNFEDIFQALILRNHIFLKFMEWTSPYWIPFGANTCLLWLSWDFIKFYIRHVSWVDIMNFRNPYIFSSSTE